MDTTKPPLSPSDLHPIYNKIKTYPFSTDNEFQSGLRVILSTPLPTLTPSEIRTRTLQAQCFYISRCATPPTPIFAFPRKKIKLITFF